MDNEKKIYADPSKAFFIDMLTRDIGVTDCILDLIDNAIDRAVERSDVKVMDLLEEEALEQKIEGAEINIDYSSSSFAIKDTCGGITVDEARNQVFRLGNPDEHGAAHGLSVYGIGMKRAFFKLGNKIQVHSETDSEFFDVTIDVAAWKSRVDEWWFEFDRFGALSESENSGVPGTNIKVLELREGIPERLQLPSFESELRGRIASTYSLFIGAGVRIKINSQIVPARRPQLVGDPFQPVRRKFRHAGVDILIIASMSPRSDRAAHGWYVFCNGRMVLEADKTPTTGWGEGFPGFHSKFNHFVGLVYFESADVRQLPWRTTKQGVEKESPVYQAALNEMKLQARPILDFLSAMYPAELEPEGVEERQFLEGAKVVEVERIPKNQATFKAPRPSRAKGATVSIQYTRPREIVTRIAEYLGEPGMSASRVGEYTFDYFVESEIS